MSEKTNSDDAKTNSAKWDSDATKGCLVCLGVLALFLLLFRSCSCRSSATSNTTSGQSQKQLNISYDEATHELLEYFEMKRSTDVDGQPRYMGNSSIGLA